MSYTPAEKGEIKADLTSLYRAGKNVLPGRAEDVAAIGTEMKGVIDSVNAQSANMGDHPITKDVLNLAIECQHGVNRAVTTLNNLAAGVIAIADDFVERDDYARTVFNSIKKELGLSDDLDDKENTPVDEPGESNREHILADGKPEGPRVSENPDAEDPDDDLAERNEQTEDNQGDLENPER